MNITTRRATLALLVAVALIAAFFATTSARAENPTTDSSAESQGSLVLTTAQPAPGDSLTFTFATEKPSATNWIAVYNNPSDGPTDQKVHGKPTAFAYVGAKTSGSVTIPGTSFTPGHDIVAYFLAQDTVTWLAPPATFSVGYPTSGSLKMTTSNPVVGDRLSFSVSSGTLGNSHGKNWVAIYSNPTDGPINQKYSGKSSAVWTYFSGSSATVTLPSKALPPGQDLTAYLLYDAGYTWLAKPVTFQLRASTAPDASGSLRMQTVKPVVGESLSFSYATASPAERNWIAIYDDPKMGPTDQTHHGSSSVWTYAAASAGTVTLASDALTPGHTISVYFLSDDGYTWLAKPLFISLGDASTYYPAPQTSHFVLNNITNSPTPSGEPIDVPLRGLWFNAAGESVPEAATFAKVAGSGWLDVSPQGNITGTTPDSDQPGTVTVTAKDNTGISDTITVDIPTRSPGAAPVLRTSYLQLWDSEHIAHIEEKTVRSVLANRFDVVGIHDASQQVAKAVADDLGWDTAQNSTGDFIISRYSLDTAETPVPTGIPATAAQADVFTHKVTVWSASLDAANSTSELACTPNTTDEDVRNLERKTKRYEQAEALAAAIGSAKKDSNAVLLLANLQSPTTADWSARSSTVTCGHPDETWPVTETIADTGLRDSFRTLNRNALLRPGQTETAFSTSASPVDAQRLAYIYFAGALIPRDSHNLVEGFPQPAPESRDNSWPSAVPAVVSTFLLANDH